jgi:hypothetical protein
MSNPFPSSPKTNASTRSQGLARTAQIEAKAEDGLVFCISAVKVAAEIGCSHTTILAAQKRVRVRWREAIPPTRVDQILESVTRLRRLQRPLWTAALGGGVDAIREIRRLEVEIDKLLDLFPNRLEITGEGGGPITFAQVPNEEKMEALRLAVLEGQRRLKAVEAEGRVVKPKALPAKPAAKKPAPKKPAAKKPAPKGQAKGSKRASKSKVKQADQPERKTAARTSAGGT